MKSPFNKDKIIIAITWTSTIILYLGFLVSYIILKDKVTFNPDIFLSEYLKFLGTLTIVILGFLIVHFYWGINKKYHLARANIENIIVNLNNLGNILRLEYPEILTTAKDNKKKKEDFNNEVQYLMKRLKKINKDVEKDIKTNVKYLKKEVKSIFENYLKNIAPQIRELLKDFNVSSDLKNFIINLEPKISNIESALKL